MSCDLAHTNICKVNNCIIQVDGMESNSASPTDTWFLTFNDETTYDGVPVKKAFLKLFIDPENTRDTLTSSVIDEIKGLEYELNVYKDIIRPLIDLDICPNFVKYLGSTKNCTYTDILNFLFGKIEDAFGRKFSITECKQRLNYNILNCLVKKCNERPPINHNIGHKISEILDPVKNSIRFDMLLTETKEGNVKYFDFINNVIIPKIDTARNILWETLFQIVAACYAMSLSKMVHNDLHSNNIFIEDLGDEKTFLYVINDTPYILKTRYKVLIYDFDRGYVNRLGNNTLLHPNFDCRYNKQCNHFVDNKDILKIMCYVFLPLIRSTSTTLPDLLNILLSSLGPELDNEIFKMYTNISSSFNDCFFGPYLNTDQDTFFRQFYTSSEIVKNIGNNLPEYTIEDFSDIDTDKLYVCNSVFFNTNGEINKTEYDRIFDETIVKLQNKNEEYKSIFRDIPIIPRTETPVRPALLRAASTRPGTPLVYPATPRAGTPIRPALLRAASTIPGTPLVYPATPRAGTPVRPALLRAASTIPGTPLVYPASPRGGTPVRPALLRAASTIPGTSVVYPVTPRAGTPVRPALLRAASTIPGTPLVYPASPRGGPPRAASARAASTRLGTPLVYPASARAGIPPRAASARAGIPPRAASPRAASPRATSPRAASARAGAASPTPTSSTRKKSKKSKKVKRSRRCKPCKKSCSRKKVCNPRTSRCVNKSGVIGKKLLSKKYLRSSKCKPCKKSCTKKKICNPRSARCVNRKGSIGKKLLRKKSK